MGSFSTISIFLVFFCIFYVTGQYNTQQKIIGGAITNVKEYPYATALLFSWDLVTYTQSCAGTILTNKAVLTASHCVYGDMPIRWRIRAGSTWANSGGSVHNVSLITVHPKFNFRDNDNDIAILRSATSFTFSTTIQSASIAGSTYKLEDNQTVWAIGWGATASGGQSSELLRHVQIWTVNQTVCRKRYSELEYNITDNMLCSGWLDFGGRDQCQGDSGGPLIHKGVIVGVCSWGEDCALARYPGVNTRVSRYTAWIQANA